MIFSNACWFKLRKCLFAVGAVDGHFSFPYFENCGENLIRIMDNCKKYSKFAYAVQ